MRYIKTIIILIVVLIATLLVTDRVVRSVWSRHVFETYYALKEKRVTPLEAAPDYVVVRDDGSTVIVFKPPLLFWSAHLSERSVEEATYAIEISRDRSKNETRIRVLQEFD